MKLAKVYDPSLYEQDIYALWEAAQAFAPTGKGAPYAVVVPPPNANGNAHLGTAITLYLEDIAIRYHRLKGDNTLFLPGADHAGFETQVVYEKKLAKEGKSRFDFTREELYAQIWDFVADNRQNFESQFRRFGGSLDWSRYTFTLDDKIVRRAHATFKKMWDEGLVYRGERLVNFCTFHGTAFADIEVTYKQEPGKLWYIRYPLADGSGEVVVATTRPETMLGDTGVAVHPDAKKYHSLVGKMIALPLSDRQIPIVADDFVDQSFGTGAVKLTPAHDQNDYDAATRHDLPRISVITHEGKISDEAPDTYQGMTVLEAREAVVADLAEQGNLVKTEELVHNVGHCYKCSTVIEPMLREQWFVSMEPLAKAAIKALEADKITFYPDTKREQLITYLKGLRDWNISRQIAWGIPIPAFQNVDQPDDWIYDERVQDAVITIGNKTYRRDSDVFDTWFSSSSWPYATLDFPDGPDFKEFYPLCLMETGGEILYPWVSRMVMLGLYVTGEVPFTEVYIHGYVMAEDGSKMSKSLGNVIDPLPVIDEFGSDALRMGLISGRTAAVNRGYDKRRVTDARNFCNKLWNVARYIEDSVDDHFQYKHTAIAETVADHWVLSKLQQSAKEMSEHLDNYRFSEAYDTLYHFVWDDVADWYIEASKGSPNKPLLARILEAVLQLAHPFAPFVTETIWQTLKWEGDSLLVTSKWPTVPAYDKQSAQDFQALQAIVSEVRFITKALQVTGATLYHNGDDFINDHANLIKQLTRLSAITKAPEATGSTGLHLTGTAHDCWLDIDKSTADAYRGQLQVKITAQAAVVKQLEGRLKSKAYLEGAPKHIVDQTRDNLRDAQELFGNLEKEYKRFDLS